MSFRRSSTFALKLYSQNSSRRKVSTTFRSEYKDFLQRISHNGCDGKITYNILNENVSEIVIDNPAKKNALSGKMINELAQIGDEILLNKEKAPFSIIIRGKGEYFCSGLNLTLSQKELDTPEKGAEMNRFMTDILNTLKQSRSIVLSLINGPAIGGGAELITASDFRIISSNAYIQYIHVKRALCPGWGE